MNPLSDFLAKYKNLGLGERLSKEAFIDAVNDVFGKKILEPSNVLLKDSVARIKAPTLVKSEILLNKTKIMEKAALKAGPAFVIKNIR